MDGGRITSKRATPWVLMLFATVPLLVGQGCPPQMQPQNNAPTANAGTDQSVNGGDLVGLNGSASSDPDGDALTFAWSQTVGTSVALTNASTATPSFIAPLTTETLSFQLTVTDNRNQTSTDSVTVTVQSPGGGGGGGCSVSENGRFDPVWLLLLLLFAGIHLVQQRKYKYSARK